MGKKVFLLFVCVAIILILFLFPGITSELSTGLTLYLKLDGNTQDSSGNNNQATVNGAIPSNEGVGGSYSFDGKDDYVYAGEYKAEQKSYTVSLRFKSSSTSVKRIFQRGKAAACFYNPSITLDNGKVSASESGCSSAGRVGGKTHPGIPFLPDQWNHIVITRDNNIVNVYLNGKFEITDNSQPTPPLGTADGGITIGTNWESRSTYTNFFDGLIDEVKIWNRPLTVEEIKEEFGVADLQTPTPTPVKTPGPTPVKTPTPVKSPSQTPAKTPIPATSPSPSPTNSIGDGGLAKEARLNNPFDVSVDANGNVYIADTYNHRIRKVDILTGVIITIAGTGIQGYKDGKAHEGMINMPSGITVDYLGNIYLADSGNNRIRKLIGVVLFSSPLVIEQAPFAPKGGGSGR